MWTGLMLVYGMRINNFNFRATREVNAGASDARIAFIDWNFDHIIASGYAGSKSFLESLLEREMPSLCMRK